MLKSEVGLLAWNVETNRLADALGMLLQHPNYASAARRLAANIIRETQEDVALRAMLRDAGHSAAAGCALYLDVTGGITLARLKDHLTHFRVASSGRGRTLLNYMKHIGIIESRPTPDEWPARFYATDRLRHSYFLHYISLLEATSFIEPEVGLIIERLGEREVFERLVIETTSGFMSGSKVKPPFQDFFDIFLQRRAGFLMVHDLIARAQTFPPEEPIAFSAADVAKQFGVSRMHVLRMKNDGVQKEIFSVENGMLSFSKSGRDAINWYYGSRIFFNLRASARVFSQL